MEAEIAELEVEGPDVLEALGEEDAIVVRGGEVVELVRMVFVVEDFEDNTT
jgi:hypothetical protein